MLKKSCAFVLAIAAFGAMACQSVASPTSEAPAATEAATATAEPTATQRPPEVTPSPSPAEAATVYGVSLSPRSYEQADFIRFLELAAEAGTALRSGNQWLDLEKANQPAEVVAQLAVQRGMVAVIETSFFVQETHAVTADVTDPATREAMVSIAGEFAGKYKPAYFGLAVELNIIEESDPAAFNAFADVLFPAAAAAIRESSPGTKVFVTFQLERLRGLRGGLFGGANEPGESDWDLLGRFPDADLISFTTYPSLIYQAPAEIPDDYYTEILEHTGKPIAFTEIGWFGESSIPGWESNPEEQADFVSRFFGLVEPVEPELVMWSFLFDQAEAPVSFATAGFFASSGEPRPSWEAWLDGQD